MLSASLFPKSFNIICNNIYFTIGYIIMNLFDLKREVFARQIGPDSCQTSSLFKAKMRWLQKLLNLQLATSHYYHILRKKQLGDHTTPQEGFILSTPRGAEGGGQRPATQDEGSDERGGSSNNAPGKRC
jgi:hypothetical protein